MLLPASALAQSTTESATTNAPATTPAPGTVGPSELQNFSLSGNVTKPSDQQGPAPKPAGSSSASPKPAVSAPAPIRRTAESRQSQREATTPASSPVPVAAPPSLPGPTDFTSADGATKPRPEASADINPQPAAPSGTLPFGDRLSLLPWLIGALALAGGTFFLLWRRRPREAFAGAPEVDPYVAPQPALPPVPSPAPLPPSPTPPRRPAPATAGIVASRLRPSLELDVQPLRCLVEDSQVTIEFEVELFNSGTAPARAVLAEASMLNAGAAQDEELATFFANPVGAGERLDLIAPMRRISLTSRVVAPRSAIQEYELAGRKAFVPVLAFNALYEWSGGKAQTSAAYLVGRETKSDKLGPLRLESVPRAFSGLAVRELPAGLRT